MDVIKKMVMTSQSIFEARTWQRICQKKRRKKEEKKATRMDADQGSQPSVDKSNKTTNSYLEVSYLSVARVHSFGVQSQTSRFRQLFPIPERRPLVECGSCSVGIIPLCRCVQTTAAPAQGKTGLCESSGEKNRGGKLLQEHTMPIDEALDQGGHGLASSDTTALCTPPLSIR
jgi:hypothetical protein